MDINPLNHYNTESSLPPQNFIDIYKYFVEYVYNILSRGNSLIIHAGIHFTLTVCYTYTLILFLDFL